VGNAPDAPRRADDEDEEDQQGAREDAGSGEQDREPDEVAAERAREQQDSEGVTT
jgi:hypothetical protein